MRQEEGGMMAGVAAFFRLHSAFRIPPSLFRV
jgi:hypothetical protein